MIYFLSEITQTLRKYLLSAFISAAELSLAKRANW